ncbi:MAG: putative photosynthetic complex assembly protein PuhE [Pseudomonadota bacterium]
MTEPDSAAHLLGPVVLVVFVWWASTAAVLWFSSSRAEHVPARLMTATVVCAAGFAAVIASHGLGSLWEPLAAFLGVIAIWGWLEFTFLTGLLVGARKGACPAGVSERTRFQLAFRAINHHEYALVGTLVAIAVISWATQSSWAFSFFALLWLMRLSAKLTIFSGAPSLSHAMMPGPIEHLKSYFRNDRIGPVFWFSTLVSTGVLVAGIVAFQAGWIDPDQRIGAAMLLTLFALAALEHWLMILPLGDDAMWLWAKPVDDQSDASGPLAKNATTNTKLLRETGAKPL